MFCLSCHETYLFPPRRPSVHDGLRIVAEYGLAFDMLLTPDTLCHVPLVASTVPDLRIVIDHLAKPRYAQDEIEEWAQGIKQAAKFGNVHLKLSGMINEVDPWNPRAFQLYVDVCLLAFGEDRYKEVQFRSLGCDFNHFLGASLALTGPCVD